MRDHYTELRSMALNEDRTFMGRVRIAFRRHKITLALAILAVLYLVAAYYDNRDYQQTLEKRLHSLSTAVLQNSCLVTNERPVGLVMVADDTNKLYSILRQVASAADKERAVLLNARTK